MTEGVSELERMREDAESYKASMLTFKRERDEARAERDHFAELATVRSNEEGGFIFERDRAEAAEAELTRLRELVALERRKWVSAASAAKNGNWVALLTLIDDAEASHEE